MSRPAKATVDYFPHYVSHGKTMYTFENKYGNDGYAFWFKTLEVLGSTEQHFLDCNDGCTLEFLLAKTRITEIVANDMLELLAKIGAIDMELWQMKIIWSENFVNNLSTVYNRREVSVYDKPQLLDYCIQKLYKSGVIVGINPQSKVKESKVKQTKEKQTKEKNTLSLSLSPEMAEAAKGFIEMRTRIKKPLNQNALDLMLKKLDGMASTEAEKIVIINESVMNSWQGIFPPKTSNIQKTIPKRDNFQQREYDDEFFDKIANSSLKGTK